MTKRYWVYVFAFFEVCLIASMCYAYIEGAYEMLGAILLIGTLIIHGVTLSLATLGLYIHQPHLQSSIPLKRNRFAIGCYVFHLLITIPLILLTLHEGSIGFQKSFG